MLFRSQFYKGLPDRLKDRISEIRKPKDLNKLRELAQSIDARYWERKAERNREGRTPSAGNKSGSAPKTSPPSNPRYSITSRTAMTPPSLLRDDPWTESHDLCCFGKLGSKAEGGYPSWTYLYNAGPHAHGARGEEGRVRGEGHISSTAGYFRGARLGHL